MSLFRIFALAAAIASSALVLQHEASAGQPPRLDASVVVDSGDDVSAWTAIASPSASATMASVAGRGSAADRETSGRAVSLEFDLGHGREHAIARRSLSLDLPSDYMFVFVLSGECEPNTLEIKFISGENVWWRRIADYECSAGWKDLRVSTPRLSFAWGPAGGGLPVHLDAIEIAIAAGKGGKGRLSIDEIRIEPYDSKAAMRPPLVRASSNADAGALLSDGDDATAWRSIPGEPVDITLDFHESIEQGGLEVLHAPGGFAEAYSVEVSTDFLQWEEVRRFTKGDGGTDPVFMPDVFARYLRLRFAPPAGRSVAIAEIRPQPFEFSSSINGFFTSIARRSPAGQYPRYFAGEQSYWTIVGVAGDSHEALVNEEGSAEVDAGGFTLEPFLFRNGKLLSWKEASSTVSLADGDLPIPSVLRRHGDLSLEVTAFAAGQADASTLYVRYRVHSENAASARLYVAVRPFQVLPPWQALNRTGGATAISRIARAADGVDVDGKAVVALTKPDAFGAAAFEQGDITAFLARGTLPDASSVEDPFAHASAALAWNLEIAPGAQRDVWVSVSYSSHGVPNGSGPEALLELATSDWRAKLDRSRITLPTAAADLERSLRSNLAYVLINRDGPAIQPGSRTYERSWIRDGAMTSGALLELGFDEEVKGFLRWFAGYIRSDGYVPCCVDARGADPVPEHDSFGEFIWAVAEVWRFTGDIAFVREMWPRVKEVAACMERLRATRMTAAFEGAPAFGLLPESISHEGYSARPVHSYWDQVFALRGFADAAVLAGVAGDEASARHLADVSQSFEQTLRDSIAKTMAAAHLDLVPASVELADFDPTSTAVAFLLGVERVYPPDALLRSFDRYIGDLRSRSGVKTGGVGYTAYELRSATALMLLGRKAEAIELLETMVGDQRPPEWNQWPEISWLRTIEPSFLGDLPHSWIGSTYLHAIRTLLVAERESPPQTGKTAGTGRLMVGAGIPLSWFAAGGEVKAPVLPTWYGSLSVLIRKPAQPRRITIELSAASSATAQTGHRAASERGFAMPTGGIEVWAPFGENIESATTDGVTSDAKQGFVMVRQLPASVVFQYTTHLENLP